MAKKGYCTAEEVITLLALDADDAAVVARVEFMLQYAEACIDGYCRTRFEWEPNATKYFNGSGTAMLTLGRFLRRLESVSVRVTDGDEWQPISAFPQPEPANEAYRWLEMEKNPRQSLQAGFFGFTEPLGSLFRPGLHNIQVIGDWGFQTDEMPSQIKLAMAYTIKYMFDMADFNSMIKMHSGLGRTVEYFSGASESIMPPFAKMVLSDMINSRSIAETIYDST